MTAACVGAATNGTETVAAGPDRDPLNAKQRTITNAVEARSWETPTNVISQRVAAALARTARPMTQKASHVLARQTNQSGQAALPTVRVAGTAPAQARTKAREEIELLPDGAIARFGPHQVTFAATTAGGIDLLTPDGVRLRSRVLGLAYLTDTGKSVMIAEVKDAEGELVSSNQVIYRGAFNDVTADLVYTYSRSALEQDVLVRSRLPAPGEYGLSKADGEVRLAILTEFLDPPEPRKTVGAVNLREHYQALGIQAGDSLPDETLNFGSMRIVAGKAFTLGSLAENVPVGKTWEVLLGPQGERRHFLIESTPYVLIKAKLDALPVKGAMHSPRAARDIKTALLQLPPPSAHNASARLMARAQTTTATRPGVVLDYLIVNICSRLGSAWGTRTLSRSAAR